MTVGSSLSAFSRSAPSKVAQKLEAHWTEAAPSIDQPETTTSAFVSAFNSTEAGLWPRPKQGPVASVPAQVAPRTWSKHAQQAARTAGSQPGDMGVIDAFKDRPSVTSEVTHWNHLESHRGQLQRASLGLLGKWGAPASCLCPLSLRLWLHLHPFSDWWKGLATLNHHSGFLLAFGNVWIDRWLDRRVSFFKNLMTLPFTESRQGL